MHAKTPLKPSLQPDAHELQFDKDALPLREYWTLGGQTTHGPMPVLYVPAGQGIVDELDVDPGGQYEPGTLLQAPVQNVVVRPMEEPKRPAGQGLQYPAPLPLNVPAGHRPAVAFVDPGMQKYPAVHAPLQLAAVMPALLP